MTPECTLHFQPRRGRFGDPIPIVWEGRYHVFYQNSPDGAGFDGMRWAHAVSSDLLQWKDLPDALAPQSGGPDAFGCWTGSVIRAGDRFHCFYTGVAEPGGRGQSVCHAVSRDLVTWERDPDNPVLLPQPPFDTAPEAAWRDPQVVSDPRGGYRLLLAADLHGVAHALRGCVAEFHSDDLVHWEARGVLYHPGTVHRCECPDLISAGGRDLLLYSDFAVQVREARTPGGDFRTPPAAVLDDFRFYAAKSALGPDGRRLLFGFLFGRDGGGGPVTDESRWEWGGVMALPRELSIDPERGVRVRPVAEAERLRAEPLPLRPSGGGAERPQAGAGSTPETMRLQAGAGGTHAELAFALVGPHPAAAEIVVQLEVDRSRGDARVSAGLLFGCDPSLSRGYALEFDPRMGQLLLRRLLPERNSSALALQQVALPGRSRSREFRVIIDHTVVEAFVDDRVSLSGRVYQPAASSSYWGVFVRNAALTASGMRAWRLAQPGDR